MKCPIDDTELKMTDRQGVEIDYCSKCRGVRLDRGELDKILDRVQGDSASNSKETLTSTPRSEPQYVQQPYPPQQYYGKHGRRKGLLGELFDF